ncbi:UNVERIFIED_CONTAM: hypothetical protein PYX00_005985 [Menopon gallinae]|uniref:Uncharacterized protein n=1 Tax=Menopon gallinae TaxID=328185 RepID=A0AAW2HTE5_9NEOP
MSVHRASKAKASPRKSRLGSAEVADFKTVLLRTCRHEDVMVIPTLQKLQGEWDRQAPEPYSQEVEHEEIFGGCAPPVPPVIQVIYEEQAPIQVICKGFYVEYALIHALFAALSSFPTITALKIEDCCISNEVVCTLAVLIPESPIVDLSLDGNVDIARDLPMLFNIGLHHLSLRRCSLTDEVMQKICKELEYNPRKTQKLLSLNLNMNCIGDEGCLALARALRSNRTLVSLSLCGNWITDEGACYLADVISKFRLTHEEIMLRRRRNFDRLLSRKTILDKALETWRTKSEIEKLKMVDRIAGKRARSMEAGQKGTLSSREKRRGMSYSEKSRSKRKSEARERATLIPEPSPTEMKDILHWVDSEVELDDHPFVAEVELDNCEYYCRGCWRLGNLNLAYNRITEHTVGRFLEAVCYQDQAFSNPRRGLLRLVIQPGNAIPRDSCPVAELNCVLQARCRKETTSEQVLDVSQQPEKRPPKK